MANFQLFLLRLRWEHLAEALPKLSPPLGEQQERRSLRPLRDRALVLVMYDCLLRVSEVPRLTLEGLSQGPNGFRLRVIR